MTTTAPKQETTVAWHNPERLYWDEPAPDPTGGCPKKGYPDAQYQAPSSIKAIFVSGGHDHPYNVERRRNIQRAWEISLRIWQLPGAYAICPPCNTLNMGGPAEYSKFMESELDLVRRADAVFMLYGWQYNIGATTQRAEALRLGKPVFYQLRQRPEEEEFFQLREWLEKGTVKEVEN